MPDQCGAGRQSQPLMYDLEHPKETRTTTGHTMSYMYAPSELMTALQVEVHLVAHAP